MTVWML
jgi:ATP-dependent DNA ligase